MLTWSIWKDSSSYSSSTGDDGNLKVQKLTWGQPFYAFHLLKSQSRDLMINLTLSFKLPGYVVVFSGHTKSIISVVVYLWGNCSLKHSITFQTKRFISPYTENVHFIYQELVTWIAEELGIMLAYSSKTYCITKMPSINNLKGCWPGHTRKWFHCFCACFFFQ